MANLPATGDITALATNAEAQLLFETLRDWLSQLPASAEVELTISSGTITQATRDQGSITVETEAAASSDDLANIAQTNVQNGALLLMRAADAAHTVVVKHAAGGDGQMLLQYNADFSLDDTDKWLLVKRVGTNWEEVLRSYGNDPGAQRRDLGFKVGANIASGATTDLGAATGNTVTVTHSTGTTAITSLGGASLPAGTEIETIFSISGGTLTITHHATNLYLAGGANITLANGDTIRWKKMHDSNAEWKMVGGVRASGAAWASSIGLPRSYLAGFVLSNNGTDATNDIDIASGACRDSTNAADIVLATALTKRLDANWAAGTNQGGLDTGSIANTTYHVWLIKRSDTGVVDALFSTSATAPTMPPNYDYKRRIGSIIRAAEAIRAFTQVGDEFLYATPVLDVDVTSLGTTGTLYTLSVPSGVQVRVFFNYRALQGSARPLVYFSSPDVTDQAPSASASPLHSASESSSLGYSSPLNSIAAGVRTNASAQIRARSDTPNTTLKIATLGWVDQRGRDY